MWSSVVQKSLKTVTVSDVVTKKREEKNNQAKREEMVKLFGSYELNDFNDEYLIMGLRSEINKRNLTEDSIFFKMLFKKYPKYTPHIAEHLLPNTLLQDSKFMMEIYSLTKCKELFAGKISNVDLLLQLMKIDVQFFSYCSMSILYDGSQLLKIVEAYPMIRNDVNIPSYITDYFQMIQSCVLNLNSIRAFLVSIQQIKKRHPFSSFVRSNVCSYLSSFPYLLAETFIGEIPSVLETRCRCKIHFCHTCKKLKELDQELAKHAYSPTPLAHNVRNKVRKLRSDRRIIEIHICTGPPYNCANCLRSDDRKLWYNTIRSHATLHRYRVF